MNNKSVTHYNYARRDVEIVGTYFVLSTVNEPSDIPAASADPSLLKVTDRTLLSMVSRTSSVFSSVFQILGRNDE